MLEHLMHGHHYLSILIGTIFQGETFVFLAGLLAYKGHVNFSLAVMAASFGALSGDLFFYFIGRLTGMAVVRRFPFLTASVTRAQQLLRRYGVGSIFIVRYIQGVRAFNALVLGSTGMGFLRFSLLTLASCTVWAVLGCGVGYFVANPLHITAFPWRQYQALLLTGTVLLLLAPLVVYRVRTFSSARID